jgi:hypothetical protein
MGDVFTEDVESMSPSQRANPSQWTIETSSLVTLPSSRVMLLPARLDFTGPAKVDEFMPAEPHLAPALQFRGRDLKAEKIDLSDNMTGLVVKRTDNDTEQSNFAVTSRFSSLYLLHRGATLNDRAELRQTIMNWPKFANALHAD